MAETDTEHREDIVRDYLKLVNNPDDLIDLNLIEDLKEKLNEATDPVERVKLRTHLDEARRIPTEEIESKFIKNVVPWIKEAHISVPALLEEGVSPEVLQSAGVELNGHTPKAKKKAPAKKKAAKKATAKKAAKPTSTEEVVAHLTKARKPFTIPGTMETTGASRATVKKAIDTMIEDGTVVETDETESSGRGRAATLYKRS